jgi:hypothetical protein
MIVEAPSDAFRFLSEINRGGLVFPTHLAINVANCVQQVLSVFMSEDVEPIFLSVRQQASILQTLAYERFCAANPHLVATRCEDCDVQLYFIVKQIVDTVSLTLLSEYVRRKSQSADSSENMSKLKKK